MAGVCAAVSGDLTVCAARGWRARGGAVYCRGSMYVFAGMHFTNDRGRFAQFNNVYRLNLKTMLWSEIITSGARPLPTLCAPDKSHRGKTRHDTGRHVCRCAWSRPAVVWLTHRLFLYTSPWLTQGYSLCVLSTGDIPGPRDKHTAVVWEHGDNDPLMIVYAGRDPNNYLKNETYVLNLANHTWKLQKTTTAAGTYDSPVTHKRRHYPHAVRIATGTGDGLQSSLVFDMVATALYQLGEYLCLGSCDDCSSAPSRGRTREPTAHRTHRGRASNHANSGSVYLDTRFGERSGQRARRLPAGGWAQPGTSPAASSWLHSLLRCSSNMATSARK